MSLASRSGKSSSDEKHKPHLGEIASYLALVFGVFPATMSAVRIYVAADGEDSNVRILTSTLDITSLLLGTFASVTPFLIVMALYVVLMTALPDALKQRNVNLLKALMIGAVVAVATSILLTPAESAALILVGLAAGCCVLLSLRVWGSIPEDTGPLALHRLVRSSRLAISFANLLLVGLLVLMAVIIFFGPAMWLPTEVVSSESEPARRTVYILFEEDDELVVRLHANGNILRMKDSEITYRQFCTLYERELGTPIVNLLMQGGSASPKEMKVERCP